MPPHWFHLAIVPEPEPDEDPAPPQVPVGLVTTVERVVGISTGMLEVVEVGAVVAACDGEVEELDPMVTPPELPSVEPPGLLPLEPS